MIRSTFRNYGIILIVVLLSIYMIIQQSEYVRTTILDNFSSGDTLQVQNRYHEESSLQLNTSPQPNTTIQSYFLEPKKSFGACLMMKEDNDLLYEWIAYHFLMLPLRYLVIGSDKGNTQDPRDVLQRWNQTGLKWWVMEASDFYEETGKIKSNGKKSEEENHIELVQRQKGFVGACTKFMKDQGMHWVAYFDNDEFIVINPFSNNDDEEYFSTYSEQNMSHVLRDELSNNVANYNNSHNSATVLDVITHMENKFNMTFEPCYTLPRLRFGSLETISCPNADHVNQHAMANYNYASMSTLRFKQNGSIRTFAANRFGKVFMDVSRIENVTTLSVKNVHRPYQNYCKRPIVSAQTVLFLLNHYTASWARYISRNDGRRSCENYMRLAFFDAENSCEQNIHQWLPQFENIFGIKVAQYLLGAELVPPRTNKTCSAEGYNFENLRREYGLSYARFTNISTTR